MLDNLASESAQYTIRASDSVAGQTSHICLSTLSDKRPETGGLHGTLRLAIGARVVLTTNVDVSDCLVNGARGEVVNVVTNDDHAVTSVLVKFDEERVGVKQSSLAHIALHSLMLCLWLNTKWYFLQKESEDLKSDVGSSHSH